MAVKPAPDAEWQRICKLTPEELDAELLAHGIQPDAVARQVLRRLKERRRRAQCEH